MPLAEKVKAITTTTSHCASTKLRGDDARLAGRRQRPARLALPEEEAQRLAEGRAGVRIPMRPDHGHVLVDDVGKALNPSGSRIGRLKGLAEILGVMAAARRPPPGEPAR